MSDPNVVASSRVAIKLGASASSGGGRSSKDARPRKTPTFGKRHRAHGLDHDSGSDDDDGDDDGDDRAAGRREAITSYGPGGAGADDFDSSRRRRRRGRSDSPEGGGRGGRRDRRDERGAARRGGLLREVDPADADKPIHWGLTINSKAGQRGRERSDRSREGGGLDADGDSPDDGGGVPSTADEEAMAALLSDPKQRKKRAADVGSQDRDPVAEDYKSIPVEDFGATILRGFGWDGKMRGKVKEVAKHANLTGLGARNAKGAEDLDAWSQKNSKDSGGNRSRPVRLDEYRREEEKRRQLREDRHGDSYRRERDREKDQDRDRRRR